MKQVRYHRYGKPDVLVIEEVAKPQLSSNQLLVRVSYVGLNPKDAALRNGFLKQLRNRSFPKLTGFDYAGSVEEVGKNVHEYQVGDRVMGYFEDLNGGAAAEFAAVKPDHISRLSIDEKIAASVPCVYLTALQAYQQVRLRSGEKVLVYGASGGVGTAAIQLGKYFGAEVTAVASSKNSSYCLGQGADHFIAYDKSDPFDDVKKYNHFFQVHVITGDRYSAAKNLLMKNGKFITLTPNPIRKLGNIFRSKKIFPIVVRARSEDLQLLDSLISKGELNPQISEEFSMEDIRKAHSMIQSQHVRGKIVLKA